MPIDDSIPESFTPLQAEMLKICRESSKILKDVFLEYQDKPLKLQKRDPRDHADAACIEAVDVLNDGFKGKYNKRLLCFIACDTENILNAKVKEIKILDDHCFRFEVTFTRVEPCGCDFHINGYLGDAKTITTTVQIRSPK